MSKTNERFSDTEIISSVKLVKTHGMHEEDHGNVVVAPGTSMIYKGHEVFFLAANETVLLDFLNHVFKVDEPQNYSIEHLALMHADSLKLQDTPSEGTQEGDAAKLSSVYHAGTPNPVDLVRGKAPFAMEEPIVPVVPEVKIAVEEDNEL